jgi:teichuronic acid biosynthesis glycosyltransferase TuaG
MRLYSNIADVSVIIPYHNRERYVDEAIRSIQAQTVKPLEIIVVNDASGQASRQHLERWEDVCRIIDLEKNVGPSAARNEGIRQARGKFVAFIDDDDLWLPHKLEVQLRHMEQHPDCVLLSSTVTAFYIDRELVSTYLGPPPVTLPQALTYGFHIIPSTYLLLAQEFRAIGGFDVGLRAGEDEDLVIRLCAAGKRVDCLAEPLVRLRRESQDRLTKKNWLVFRTDVQRLWKHKALFHSVFGLRGILSFLLERLHFVTCETPYLDGRVRFLLRVFKVKYEIKKTYREALGRVL